MAAPCRANHGSSAVRPRSMPGSNLPNVRRREPRLRLVAACVRWLCHDESGCKGCVTVQMAKRRWADESPSSTRADGREDDRAIECHWLWTTLGVCLLLPVVVLFTACLQRAFGTVSLSGHGWVSVPRAHVQCRDFERSAIGCASPSPTYRPLWAQPSRAGDANRGRRPLTDGGSKQRSHGCGGHHGQGAPKGDAQGTAPR